MGTLEEARASGVEMGWVGDTFRDRGTTFGLLSAGEGRKSAWKNRQQHKQYLQLGFDEKK